MTQVIFSPLESSFRYKILQVTFRAILFVVFLDFLCSKFVKPKILFVEVSLQNSDFCRGFQNFEFPELFEFAEFLDARKVTLDEKALETLVKEHRISKIQWISYNTMSRISNSRNSWQNIHQKNRPKVHLVPVYPTRFSSSKYKSIIWQHFISAIFSLKKSKRSSAFPVMSRNA